MNRITMIKKAQAKRAKADKADAKKAAADARAIVEMNQLIVKVAAKKESNKADAKAAAKKRRKMVKEAKEKYGEVRGRALDINSAENLFYSDEETMAFIADSPIMDAYNEASKDWD